MFYFIIIPILFMSFLPMAGNAIPAFPGAEGWGADTPGGRGGKVYIVTNKNPMGPGSFIDALRKKEPRIIVFAVSGVIQLAPWFEPDGNYSHVTIAGQTSPGGVTFTGNMAHNAIYWCYNKCRDDSSFHDGILRFLRFRATKNNVDCFEITYSRNLIIDHCDFSGAIDETFGIQHSHDYTVQWCMITNGSGGQNFGVLMTGKELKHFSYHHNLVANYTERCGSVSHWGFEAAPENGLLDFRNNVSYNMYTYAYNVQGASNDVYVNFVGNYFKAGPRSRSTGHFLKCVSMEVGIVYDTLNCYEDTSNTKHFNVLKTWNRCKGFTDSAYSMPPITTETGEQAFESVLAKGGVWPRDSMVRRTVNEVRTGTGTYLVDNDPHITDGPEPPADSDSDGMPDCFEKDLGLNPDNASDNNDDHDNDGYLNIEEYINDIASAKLGDALQNSGTCVDSLVNAWQPLKIETGKTPVEKSPLAISQYPNPFNPRTSLYYTLKTEGRVQVKIFNLKGVAIKTVEKRVQEAGRHNVEWDGTNQNNLPVTTGTYIVQMEYKGKKYTRKISMVK